MHPLYQEKYCLLNYHMPRPMTAAYKHRYICMSKPFSSRCKQNCHFTILISCHCVSTEHSPLLSPDFVFPPSDWKQITFGYMAICYRENKIEHKFVFYFSRGVLRYVHLEHAYLSGIFFFLLKQFPGDMLFFQQIQTYREVDE